MRTSEERGGETEREFKKENKFKFVIEGPKQICFHLLWSNDDPIQET